jgi:nitroimidazol reductase NimA-like FMN-containing flavoprotein (pyridoxamine 5'-phosphate oxidase superfamily)
MTASELHPNRTPADARVGRLATSSMTLDHQTELSAAETDAVLGRHETGVLALAEADEPYAIPISYGYDAEHRRFYLRLVSTPESEKRRFLSSSPRTRLVVYEEDDDTYRSVLAIGTLEAVGADDITVEHIVQYGDTKRPLFEMWGRTRDALDIELYQLDPEQLTGRRVDLDRTYDE